eukprot:12961735-Alexandrium_andersonii.AAC.1
MTTVAIAPEQTRRLLPYNFSHSPLHLAAGREALEGADLCVGNGHLALGRRSARWQCEGAHISSCSADQAKAISCPR